MASQSETNVLELVTLAAIDAVLPIISLLGTDFCVQELSESGWESDEGCSGIKDDSGVVELGGCVTVRDGVKIDLPVGFASERDLGELAGKVVFVDTAECGDRLFAVLVGVTEVECKYRFVQQVLVDHIVERWHNLVDADGIIAETHDTVESAESEGKTRLRGSFGEILILDGEISDPHSVSGDETAQAARSVADLELGPVFLVGGGC